jgi:hypothetical protein
LQVDIGGCEVVGRRGGGAVGVDDDHFSIPLLLFVQRPCCLRAGFGQVFGLTFRGCPEIVEKGFHGMGWKNFG